MIFMCAEKVRGEGIYYMVISVANVLKQHFFLSSVSHVITELSCFSGRTGRVCDGICIRFMTQNIYDMQLDEYDDPEMLYAPLDKLLLQVKFAGKCGQCLMF